MLKKCSIYIYNIKISNLKKFLKFITWKNQITIQHECSIAISFLQSKKILFRFKRKIGGSLGIAITVVFFVFFLFLSHRW